MKMRFEQIGPIEKADLELKDLTIIAGENNTGKTYLAYVLYGALKIAREPFYFQQTEKILPYDCKKTAKELVEKRISKITLEKEAVIEYFNKVLEFQSDTISDILSSSLNHFSEAKVKIIPDINIESLYNIDNLNGDDELKHNEFGIIFNCRSISADKYYIEFQLKSNKRASSTFNNTLHNFEKLCKNAINYTFNLIHLPIGPLILPAERIGISLFYKELDFNKNRLLEMLQKLKSYEKKNDIELFISLMDSHSANYSQPIKDNINYIRSLEYKQKSEASLTKDFEEIKKMMGGYFQYSKNEIRFISKARKRGKFNLPLHLASSSARGLSDLYFFLKHEVKENQLLIIDEPESHLSTANQIEMARLLARCVNSGLKILITTHSDYIIKEFNNLLMLGRDFDGKTDFLERHSDIYSENDFLSPESVAGYICENGGLTPCDIDHLGLNMPSFDSVIDKINAVSNELAMKVSR